MAEIARLNTDSAKLNPERHFASPQALVDEVLLTRGEKIAALERWRLTIMHELSAATDGMPTRGVSAKHARTLRLIDEAKTALGSGSAG
jgi:hypothetical protein